ncbi:MAG: tetratricopeptide repeat protein [Nitrospirota bacterium]
MPKAIKKRVPKKMVVSAEEEVKDRLSAFKESIKEKQKKVLKYGIGILFIVIVISGFLLYNFVSYKKGAALENEAYKIYYSVGQSMNKEEQYRKALDKFKKAYDLRKSPMSLFYIAGCYYELGQYDEALSTLKDFTQKYSGEERFIPLIYHKMVTIYLKKGETKEAVKALEMLYSLNSRIYKDLALIEYGRLLEKENRLEEAKKKYRELVEKFPTSPFLDEAETKISEKKEG